MPTPPNINLRCIDAFLTIAAQDMTLLHTYEIKDDKAEQLDLITHKIIRACGALRDFTQQETAI